MHHSMLRRGPVLLLVLALVAGGTAFGQVQAEERNYDARVGRQLQSRAAASSLAQKAAMADLAVQVGDSLAVEFDASSGVARTVVNHVGNLSGKRSGDPETIAIEYAREIQDLLGLTDQDLRHYEVTNVVISRVSGASHVYLRQTAHGIALYNGQLHVNIDAEDFVMSVNNAFVHDLHGKTRACVRR